MSKQWTSSAEPGTSGPLAAAALLFPPASAGEERDRLLHTLSEQVWRLLRPTAVDVVLLAAAIDRTFCTALLLSPRTALLAFRADPDAVLGSRSRLARLGPVVRRLSDEEIDALAAIKAANLQEFALQALALTGSPGTESAARDAGAGIPVPWQPLPSLQPATLPRTTGAAAAQTARATPRQRARVTRLRFMRSSALGAGKLSGERRTASSRACHLPRCVPPA